MKHHKRIIWLLIPLIAGVAVLLVGQIKRAKDITITPSATPLISAGSFSIPSDAEEPILGNPGAPLTIVEFADLGCSDCAKTHAILSAFVLAHPEEARLIFKDAPEQKLFLKPNNLAHQAAYCAGKQGRFWQFVDAAFASKKSYLDEAAVKQLGINLKLPLASWWSCTTNSETSQKITATLGVAQQLQATDLPTVFINNRRLNLQADVDLNQLLNSFIAP